MRPVNFKKGLGESIEVSTKWIANKKLGDAFIFGDSQTPGFIPEDRFSNNRRVKLPYAIINPIFKIDSLIAWMRPLLYNIVEGGVTPDQLKNVLVHRRVYDKTLNKVVPETDVKHENEILIGTQLLQYLFNEYGNLSEFVILQLVEKAIDTVIAKTKLQGNKFPLVKTASLEMPEITKEYVEHSIQIVEDLRYSNKALLHLDKKEREEFRNLLLVELFNSRMPLIKFYEQLYNNPDSLFEGLTLSYFNIFPAGYREFMPDGKCDGINKRFDYIIKAIDNLELSQTDSYAQTLQGMRTISKNIYDILSESEDVTKYKSVKDRIKGKQGLFQSQVQKVLTDYSFRSVITLNTELPFDTIGLPYSIAAKLLEFEMIDDYNKYLSDSQQSDYLSFKDWYKKFTTTPDFKAYAEERLGGKIVALGRQPTLYRLGLQGLKVTLTDKPTAEINPLAVEAYNADFDGDQMYGFIVFSEEAIDDMETKMYALYNAALPKNGRLHIKLRLEMVYGLINCLKYMPTDDTYQNDFTLEELVNDEANLFGMCMFNGEYVSVSEAAVMKAFENYTITLEEVRNLTEASLEEKLADIYFEDVYSFKTIITNLVSLSFYMTAKAPPSISLLHPDVIDMTEMKERSKRTIAEAYEKLEAGLISIDGYNYIVDSSIQELQNIAEQTPFPDTDFTKIVKTGARGRNTSLQEAYRVKGAMHVDGVSYAILGSMREGLNETEVFLCASGSRAGLVNKVISVSEPGTLSKLLTTSAQVKINVHDCGAPPIAITMASIDKLLADDTEVSDNIKQDTLERIIRGRYVLEIIDGKLTPRLLSKKDIPEQYNILKSGMPIFLRSMVNCKCGCQICYGINPSFRALPRLGTNVGVEAGTVSGEISSQISLDAFHKGSTSSSNLSPVRLVTSLYNDSTQSYTNPNVFNFISPIDGDIKYTQLPNKTYLLQIIDSTGTALPRQIIVDSLVNLKTSVKQGEGIYTKGYITDVNLLKNYSKQYEVDLMLEMYKVYNQSLNIKHIEALISAKNMWLCVKSNDTFKAPYTYNKDICLHPDFNRENFVPIQLGLKDTVMKSGHILTALTYEDIYVVIRRTLLFPAVDPITTDLSAVMSGQRPKEVYYDRRK